MKQKRNLQKLAGILIALSVLLVLPISAALATDQEPTWETKASMNHDRGNFQTEVIDGKIYAIGGASNSLEVYDPVTNEWTELASMTNIRSFFRLRSSMEKYMR